MIRIIKGEDKEINVQMSLKNSLGVIIGPKDLTGKVITIKYKESGSETLVEIIAAALTPETQGRFVFSLSEIQTEALALGYFNFDIYLTESGNTDIERVIKLVTVEDRLR